MNKSLIDLNEKDVLKMSQNAKMTVNDGAIESMQVTARSNITQYYI